MNHRVRRAPWLLALGAAMLLIAACGSDDSESVGANQAPKDADSSPTVRVLPTQIESTPEAGVTLSPPTETTVSVTEEAARERVAAVLGDDVTRQMTGYLAILNNENIGAPDEGGSVQLDHVDRPVWAFIRYAPCDEVTPDLGPVHSSATVPADVECIQAAMADADTGEYLMAYSEASNARELGIDRPHGAVED